MCDAAWYMLSAMFVAGFLGLICAYSMVQEMIGRERERRRADRAEQARYELDRLREGVRELEEDLAEAPGWVSEAEIRHRLRAIHQHEQGEGDE